MLENLSFWPSKINFVKLFAYSRKMVIETHFEAAELSETWHTFEVSINLYDTDVISNFHLILKFLLLWQCDKKWNSIDEKKTIKNLYAGDINLNTWNTNFQFKNISYVLVRLDTEAYDFIAFTYFHRLSVETTMVTKWIRQ